MLRSKLRLVPVLGIFLLGTACNFSETQVEVALENNPYFDLKGLINQQIEMLDSLNPRVQMEATISGEVERQTMQKDSADWAETLKLFAEADLNKPVLRDQYLVSDSSLAKSGLNLRSYQAKRPQEVDIPYMKVYYQDSLSEVRQVETMFREDNPLYSTQRQMQLLFNEVGGSLRIMSYNTQGKQKMIFRDSVLYKTEAQLVY